MLTLRCSLGEQTHVCHHQFDGGPVSIALLCTTETGKGRNVICRTATEHGICPLSYTSAVERIAVKQGPIMEKGLTALTTVLRHYFG
jgi:hypothetical protein